LPLKETLAVLFLVLGIIMECFKSQIPCFRSSFWWKWISRGSTWCNSRYTSNRA